MATPPVAKARLGPLCLAAFSLVVGVPRASAQSVPWTVTETTTIGDKLDLDGIGSTVLAADGSLYVLNSIAGEIVHLDVSGMVLWRAGRKGRGPGEFVRPSRLAPRPKGGVIVVDSRSLIFFGPRGTYEKVKTLPVNFSRVDAIVETATGEIVISGVVARGPDTNRRSAESAVHVFGADMTLLRSFGPLPRSSDIAGNILRMWGAGELTLGSDGTLWYARRLPYELYQFALDGKVLRTVVMPRVAETPDDFMSQRLLQTNSRTITRFSPTSVDVPRPAAVVEISPSLLATGLIRRRGNTIDVVSAEGTQRSVAMPAGWGVLVGFDRARSYLWATALVDDVPVLIRQRIVLDRR